MATKWTGPFPLPPVGDTPVVGDVADFDEDRGLGTIEYGMGRTLPFHCTAITDGSRRIDVGAVVAFVVTPGRLGRLEAHSVRPLPGVVRPGRSLHADAVGPDRPAASPAPESPPPVVATPVPVAPPVPSRTVAAPPVSAPPVAAPPVAAPASAAVVAAPSPLPEAHRPRPWNTPESPPPPAEPVPPPVNPGPPSYEPVVAAPPPPPPSSAPPPPPSPAAGPSSPAGGEVTPPFGVAAVRPIGPVGPLGLRPPLLSPDRPASETPVEPPAAESSASEPPDDDDGPRPDFWSPIARPTSGPPPTWRTPVTPPAPPPSEGG